MRAAGKSGFELGPVHAGMPGLTRPGVTCAAAVSSIPTIAPTCHGLAAGLEGNEEMFGKAKARDCSERLPASLWRGEPPPAYRPEEWFLEARRPCSVGCLHSESAQFPLGKSAAVGGRSSSPRQEPARCEQVFTSHREPARVQPIYADLVKARQSIDLADLVQPGQTDKAARYETSNSAYSPPRPAENADQEPARAQCGILVSHNSVLVSISNLL